MKFKQEDGTEVEALTAAEVEAKLASEKAAIEAGHKDVVTEKDTAIANLASEKKELEDRIKKAELDGIRDDHPNFKILKEALAKKDTDIAALKTEIDTDKKTRKEEAMNNEIKSVSKGNDEFEKKIRLHLKETLASLPEETADQISKKLEAAIKLSTDGSNDGPGMFDGGVGGSGKGSGYGEGSGAGAVEFTAREKALGAKLGITDADYKKYGSKLTIKIK